MDPMLAPSGVLFAAAVRGSQHQGSRATQWLLLLA